MHCQFLASERHNLHDGLCTWRPLIDRAVISFDGESLLNALLYGSDEFNDKINKEILLRIVALGDLKGLWKTNIDQISRKLESNLLYWHSKYAAKKEPSNLADIYLLKVNNKNTRARCEICSKLTIKTLERRQEAK